MESNPGKWEFFDHTADAKFKAWGKDLAELYQNAAKATFAIITDIERVQPVKEFPIEIKAAGGKEPALFDFLDELLFLLDTEGFLPPRP
jgi:SHS2 domain-containing protein